MEEIQHMRRFNLFDYLKQKDDAEATIYRCGYYIINKYTNKINSTDVKDTFYTIYDDMLLKFNMMQRHGVEYFNVYKLKNFTENDWLKIDILLTKYEDIDENMIDTLLNLNRYNPLGCDIHETSRNI